LGREGKRKERRKRNKGVNGKKEIKRGGNGKKKVRKL